MPTHRDIQKAAQLGQLIEDYWMLLRNPHQVPGGPGREFDYFVWYLQAGLGSGKTAAASHYFVARLLKNPGYRLALMSQTNGAVRGTMLEGKSGILTIIKRLYADKEVWEHSKIDGRVTLPNGSMIQYFTSERPDRIRGPEFHDGWIDEPAILKNWKESWDNFRNRVRLPWPEKNHLVLTGTPESNAFIRFLAEQCKVKQDWIETNASTMDNADNLSQDYIEGIQDEYAGTRFWAQEIEGQLILQAEGALWDHDWYKDIDRLPEFDITAIGIDPADSHAGDMAGIIAGGRFRTKVKLKDRESKMMDCAVILEDATQHGSYNKWKWTLVKLTRKWSVSRWLVEKSIGQSMVDALEEIIREEDLSVKIEFVPAVGTKSSRAENATAKYEQGRVFHWTGENLDELVTEQLEWEPADTKSPNRIDAVAYLINDLLKPKAKSRGFAPSDL